MGILEIAAVVTVCILVLGVAHKIAKNWEDRVVTDALFKRKLIKAVKELEPNEGTSLVDRVGTMETDIKWIKSTLGDKE